DGDGSHGSTSKTPSYTKSVSWHHYRLRVDDEVVIENLTKDSRIEALQQIHTGIILSTNLLNALSEEDAITAEEA
ncbi:flagellar transcriptional regulator FlhD, partial [Enterobacter cloacae]|uniref:flagellar transcriptional regulator FlhD n=1 Tax=Enterobacter cloacae TaxID=550 RepID=UPI003B83A94B